jgi:hypothetical protein
MQPVTVLVIEEGAEATLVCAALARQAEVRVLDAPDFSGALTRLKTEAAPVAFAIMGPATLAKCTGKLVQSLETRGIPVVGIALGLAAADRQRALAAGVREIHDRPAEWKPYSELIDSLVARFTLPS